MSEPSIRRRTRPMLVGVALALALVASGCQWSMARFDATGSGFNPNETEIGVAEVGGVALELTAAVAGTSTTVPVVSGSTVVVTTSGAGGGVRAYDLSGTSCTGAPLSCEPLWTAASGSTVGQAIVADGRVIVGVGSNLHAYDVAGVAGCSGSPVICQPQWTAPGWAGNAVAADGLAYVSRSTGLGVFDVAGVDGCSGTPTTCAPRWTYAVENQAPLVGLSPPVLADGVLYVGTQESEAFINGGYVGTIQAFDAAGVDSCSGAPSVCTPQWYGSSGAVFGSPAVVDGVVYVGGIITGFDEENFEVGSSSVTGWDTATCSGPFCQPSWNAPVSDFSYATPAIAVAGGLLHVTDPDDSTVATYATGAASPCAPGGAPCVAERRSNAYGTPSIANGLLYVGPSAFDITGTTACTGAPALCQPLWTSPVAGTRRVAIPTNNKIVVWARTGTTSALSVFDLV